jgi:hypothetical protein
MEQFHEFSAAANKDEDITVPDITAHLLMNYAN